MMADNHDKAATTEIEVSDEQHDRKFIGNSATAEESNLVPGTAASSQGTPTDSTPEQSDGVGANSKPGPEGAAALASSPTPWQAIFSPQYNAYYFYNAETQQTTWENPLLPVASSSSTSTASEAPKDSLDGAGVPGGSSASSYAALQAAAMAAGIDPSLAHLDPSLQPSLPSFSGVELPGMGPSFTAKFNARTGQFTRPDGRDPTHLSEHARAQRMSEFYFDVNAWQDQLAEQGGSIKGSDETKKRKRPSKKDLERFKEQKRLKKIAKTAWLRT